MAQSAQFSYSCGVYHQGITWHNLLSCLIDNSTNCYGQNVVNIYKCDAHCAIQGSGHSKVNISLPYLPDQSSPSTVFSNAEQGAGRNAPFVYNAPPITKQQNPYSFQA